LVKDFLESGRRGKLPEGEKRGNLRKCPKSQKVENVATDLARDEITLKQNCTKS